MSNTSSGFQLILNALDEYMKQTGINLKENPFADKVFGCRSPDDVLQRFQENVNAFKEYRDKNRKFIDCVSPVVKVIHAFSEVLGETAWLGTGFQGVRVWVDRGSGGTGYPPGKEQGYRFRGGNYGHFNPDDED
ncbi:hypothetical protein EI94DRAFT_1708466 [Lactarius quietus]|nr:hypothetical protein EI94DRAFT_1708466 [Lactarius quietus]